MQPKNTKDGMAYVLGRNGRNNPLQKRRRIRQSKRWEMESRLEQPRHNNLFCVETGLVVDRCVFEWRGGENFCVGPVVESPSMTSLLALGKVPIQMLTRFVAR